MTFTRKHSPWRTLAALAAMTAALSGCGHKDSGTTTAANNAAPGAKTYQLAVIPKGTSHEYWKTIHAGAISAQQDLAKKGINVNILWKGTQSEGDRNGQVNIVETFVTQKVDGMVLAPLDNQALVTPVHDAVSRKIPIVIMDSSLNGSDWSAFVATNNEKGGELAGDDLAKEMGGKGNVIMLAYAQGSASTEQRELGFMTAMKRNPGITVLSSNQYGGPTSDAAYKTSQNLLARYGSTVNGVFASNETNTRGMRLALKDKGLLHKVKFVGFDAAADLVQALQASEIQALIVQNPFKMGYEGVTTLVDVLQGKAVPKSVDTGVAVITTANMAQPDMQQFLNPPTAKFVQ